MTAKTAVKRKPKVQPTPRGSTYIKPGEIDWKPSPFPGI
jgi:hypothetical protein